MASLPIPCSFLPHHQRHCSAASGLFDGLHPWPDMLQEEETVPHVKEPQHKKEQEPVPAGKDEFGDGVQVGLLVMVSLLVGFEK